MTALPDHWTVLTLRTPTLPPATATNTAIVGKGRVVIIDPGTPHKKEQSKLFESLESRLDAGAEIAGIFLTHHHSDHHGAVSKLLSWCRDRGQTPPVMAHRLTFDEVPSWEAERREIEHDDIIDLDGAALRALLTPGHTHGHLSVLDEATGVAYGGDMVASEGTIVINPPEGDMAAYLRSLELLLTHRIETLVPSHGAPIDAVEDLLKHYIEHRLRREALVLGALTDAPRRALALVPKAYPGLALTLYPLAARSLTAHLIKLEGEGRARRTGSKWSR